MKVKIITFTLTALGLICGIFLLCFGISGSITLNAETKNYESTEGYFWDYSIYSEADHTGRRRHTTTYQLTYVYTVGDYRYTVSTDYGTGTIPKHGSAVEIRYDPNDPENAIIVGTNRNTVFIFIGVFFIIVSGMILSGFMHIMEYIKLNFNFMDIFVGFILTGMGIGVIYVFAGSLSISNAFKQFGFFAIIPFLFIILGIYQLIRSIFFPKNKTD